MVKQVELNFRDVTSRYPDLTPAETGLRFRNEFPGSVLQAFFNASGAITGFSVVFSTAEAETFFWLKW